MKTKGDQIFLYGKVNSIFQSVKYQLEKALIKYRDQVDLITISDPARFIEAGIEKIPTAEYRNVRISFEEDEGIQMFIKKVMKEVMSKSKDKGVKQVIVPVDFSNFSRQAFYQGVKMAAKLDASVLVVYIFTPVVVPAEGMLYMDPELQKDTQDRFNNFFQDLMSGLTDHDRDTIEVGSEFRVGMVTQQLQETIRENDGSMVVMSTSGEGNRTKELLGSVSLWMVKNAECPILLVPPSRDHVNFEKIVFACDHFGLYDDALSAIKYYSGSPGAQIDIIHVFQKGSEYMDKGVEVLHENKEKHVKEVILFDPSFLESIQTYVKNNHCDLLVMERKDRGFWGELFHVSKTRKMAVYSGVPLLVLHNKEIRAFAGSKSQKENV